MQYGAYMRTATVLVNALVLPAHGCTFIGAGIGGLVPRYGDTEIISASVSEARSLETQCVDEETAVEDAGFAIHRAARPEIRLVMVEAMVGDSDLGVKSAEREYLVSFDTGGKVRAEVLEGSYATTGMAIGMAVDLTVIVAVLIAAANYEPNYSGMSLGM